MAVAFGKQDKLFTRCTYLKKISKFRNIQSEVTSSSGKTRAFVSAQWKSLETVKNQVLNVYSVISYKTALKYSKVLHNLQQKAISNATTTLEGKLSEHDNSQPTNARIKNTETSKPIPKWKDPLLRGQATNLSQAHLIISSIKSAWKSKQKENIQACVHRLSEYLLLHPDEKHTFIKKDIVQILLRIRRQTHDEDQRGMVRQVLVQLGYTDPLSGNGIRVLSIDGGGVRGILVIEMLKKLEELTGKRVYEMFDFVCGVSTGAILTSLLVAQQMSLNELSKRYKEMSMQIFRQSPFQGTKNLVWSHSYYDTSVWETILKENFGEHSLISTARKAVCPKICAVSAVVNQSQLSAYLFRNYALPWKVQSQYMGGYNHAIWEAVRASAAAPTYFEEFKLGNLLHQDGGILINNPTAVAIHEAKLLWPHAPIQCVVSFGTGRSVPNPGDCKEESVLAKTSSWKNKFLKIVESATDTEGVHTMLSDLLPENTYFRFNPYLTEKCNIEETDPLKLEQMERDAIMYLRRNDDKFKEAAESLNKLKNIHHKLYEWVSLKGKSVSIFDG